MIIERKWNELVESELRHKIKREQIKIKNNEWPKEIQNFES
jgi:hypothetical protein